MADRVANPVSLALLLAALLVASCGHAGATTFKVGGDAGWVPLPSGMYNDWVYKHKIRAGDTLHFSYKNDSVMEVTGEEYNNCWSSHPIFVASNGDTDVVVDRPGLFYFISGVVDHCDRGQKMAIDVTEAPPQPSPSLSGGAVEAPRQPSPSLSGGVVEAPPQPSPSGGAVEAPPQPSPSPSGGAVEAPPQSSPSPSGGVIDMIEAPPQPSPSSGGEPGASPLAGAIVAAAAMALLVVAHNV